MTTPRTKDRIADTKAPRPTEDRSSEDEHRLAMKAAKQRETEPGAFRAWSG
jgi:hypothetical protein